MNFADLLEKFLKVPIAQKFAGLVVVMVAIVAGYYFLFYGDQELKIKRANATLKDLNAELLRNRELARNLQQYKREVELLKIRFNEAKQLLPDEAQIASLIKDLHGLAEKQGLTIEHFGPLPERPQGFVAAVPIEIRVSGGYHEIATFFDSVAKLPRIVNINDYKLTAPNVRRDKVVLSSSFVATTYRFIEPKKH